MKILLFEPPSCVIGLSNGLAYIAAVLKRAGHDVYGVSLANHKKYDPDLLQQACVETFAPDVIGYSIYYISVKPFKKLIKDLRRYYKGITIVGGPQLNLENDNLLKEIPELDYAIVGEAEETILELLEVINGMKNPKEVHGLVYRSVDRSVFKNEAREPNRNLDDIPFPDHRAFGIRKTKTYFLMSSRGCPYRCTFCNRNSDIWRPRSPHNLIRELKHAVHEYKIKNFSLNDTFNIRPKRVVEFCDLLIKENLNLSWHCSGARCDHLDIEMLEKMKASGCKSINVGIETLQPDVFSRINKGETLEEIIDGINKAKAIGINVHGYFIIGLPGDTPEGAWDTFQKAQRLGVNSASFAILLPFPGTKIFDELHSDNTVTWLEDYHDVTTFWAPSLEWSQIRTSYETPNFSAKSKIALFHRIRTVQGDPRPPYHPNPIVFMTRCILYLIKYCPFLEIIPAFFRMSGDIIRRLVATRGRTVSKVDVEYDSDFLPIQRYNELVNIKSDS